MSEGMSEGMTRAGMAQPPTRSARWRPIGSVRFDLGIARRAKDQFPSEPVRGAFRSAVRWWLRGLRSARPARSVHRGDHGLTAKTPPTRPTPTIGSPCAPSRRCQKAAIAGRASATRGRWPCSADVRATHPRTMPCAGRCMPRVRRLIRHPRWLRSLRTQSTGSVVAQDARRSSPTVQTGHRSRRPPRVPPRLPPRLLSRLSLSRGECRRGRSVRKQGRSTPAASRHRRPTARHHRRAKAGDGRESSRNMRHRARSKSLHGVARCDRSPSRQADAPPSARVESSACPPSVAMTTDPGPIACELHPRAAA